METQPAITVKRIRYRKDGVRVNGYRVSNNVVFNTRICRTVAERDACIEEFQMDVARQLPKVD